MPVARGAELPLSCPLLSASRRGWSAYANDVLTIVAPAAPGGGWDQTARVMQQALTEIEPGSSVQMENVPGAAGTTPDASGTLAARGPSRLFKRTTLRRVVAYAGPGRTLSYAALQHARRSMR